MPEIELATASPSRRERKREQLAGHLTETAFRLFEAHGYEAISMERIAAEADVAKATLYNYFPIKEALLAHRFRREITAGMADLDAALQRHTSFASRMRFLLQQSAAWHAGRRIYMPHYLQFRRSHAGSAGPQTDSNTYGSDTRQILESMFRAAQSSGEIRSDHAPDRLAWMFEYMLVGAVSAWLKGGGDLNGEFQFALELLLQGIVAPCAAASGKGKRYR